jgi:hypothetical protein
MSSENIMDFLRRDISACSFCKMVKLNAGTSMKLLVVGQEDAAENRTA